MTQRRTRFPKGARIRVPTSGWTGTVVSRDPEDKNFLLIHWDDSGLVGRVGPAVLELERKRDA